MKRYVIKRTPENDYYPGGKESPHKWVSFDRAKVFKNLAGAKVAYNWIMEHSRIYDYAIELNIVEVYVVEKDVVDELENLKTAYDNLYMTYLSQVSLYKSLYTEEKKKNNEKQ